MRLSCILIPLLLTACASDPPTVDGDLASMVLALDAEELPAGDSEEGAEPTRTLPPDGTQETIVQTLDCPDGGIVKVYVRRERHPEPYERSGRIAWTYDTCGTWEFGTIDGQASFDRHTEGGPPWLRKMNYHANLSYGGSADGQCKGWVSLEQTWQSSANRMQLPTTCPHPVREWWGQLGF